MSDCIQSQPDGVRNPPKLFAEITRQLLLIGHLGEIRLFKRAKNGRTHANWLPRAVIEVGRSCRCVAGLLFCISRTHRPDWERAESSFFWRRSPQSATSKAARKHERRRDVMMTAGVIASEVSRVERRGQIDGKIPAG